MGLSPSASRFPELEEGPLSRQFLFLIVTKTEEIFHFHPEDDSLSSGDGCGNFSRVGGFPGGSFADRACPGAGIERSDTGWLFRTLAGVTLRILDILSSLWSQALVFRVRCELFPGLGRYHHCPLWELLPCVPEGSARTPKLWPCQSNLDTCETRGTWRLVMEPGMLALH